MKKALLATTALVLSAGVAAADVTISGYGRTGIIYYEDANTLAGTKDTQVSSRLRMNIDASTETDAGVEFGARFRLQWDQGDNTTGSNPAKIWVRAQGLTVEVGNVDTAMDSAGLIYAHDLGSYDRSGAFDTGVGLSANAGNFYAYSAKNYGGDNDRLGVAATYSFGDLTVRGSYVTPDQTGLVSVEKELGVSVDYKWDNRLELSAAYTDNAGGNDGEDLFFLGARYAVLDNARIGLSYFNADDTIIVGDTFDAAFGQTFALYGDYTLADGLTNIEAYVANNDGDWEGKETDNAFGIGVNYDLGGARLGASIHRDYSELVTVDAGVRFEF
ncbi:MAG TPA: porin [Paracoccus sp.]|nr:porin [Paracoccus sp. (in: a-proteobacteria)]